MKKIRPIYTEDALQVDFFEVFDLLTGELDVSDVQEYISFEEEAVVSNEVSEWLNRGWDECLGCLQLHERQGNETQSYLILPFLPPRLLGYPVRLTGRSVL